MRALILLVALALPSGRAWAYDLPQDAAVARFVTSNVIATFYHELGHGLIDVLDLPVLGREEDAADTLSAILTHQIWDEEAATAITYDTAEAYAAYAAEAESEGWETPYADTHSLDLQRYYNLVCLFYGASPDTREDVAAELELPEDRAEGCAEEWDLAESSWGAMLEDLEPGPDTHGLRLLGAAPEQDPIAAILADEIASLNESFGLPVEITVSIEECGEANAFYLPDEDKIILCQEYAPEMERLYSLE